MTSMDQQPLIENSVDQIGEKYDVDRFSLGFRNGLACRRGEALLVPELMVDADQVLLTGFALAMLGPNRFKELHVCRKEGEI